MARFSLFLSLLALILLLGAPEARAQQNLAGCQQYGAQDFEIGFWIDDVLPNSESVFAVTATNTATSATDTRIADPDVGIGLTGCNWVAHVGEPATAPERVEMDANARYTLTFDLYEYYWDIDKGSPPIETYTFTYFLCFDAQLEGSFYCPYGGVTAGYADLIFAYTDGEMRAVPTKLGSPMGASSGGDVADYFSDDGWVMPYHAEEICRQEGCTLTDGDLQDIPFLMPQEGPSYTLTADLDFKVPSNRAWTWDASDVSALKFPQGTSLVVGGDLAADGVTFTEAAAGQGWDGVAVYAGGTLGLNGVTVSKAAVGVDVYSTGNTFTNSFFTGNGVGIRSAYVQDHCPGPGVCFSGGRSSFTLDQSCVTGSDYNQQLGSMGYGIWARATDALITATTVEGNDAYGLRLDDADVAARRLLLTGNGGGNMGSQDGARAFSNGDLTLASYFEGFPDRGGVALGLNSVRDNAGDEISLTGDGYATVGLVCSLTFCPDANRVSEAGFPGDFDYLIANDTKEIIKANRTYWATTPAAPPAAAFLQPALVEAFLPLTSDPATSAGRTGGCAAPSRPGDTAATTRAMLGGEANRGEGLDAETAAWLRAQMYEMRQALAEAPGADEAADRLRSLYALQRLDRADVLGEHAATTALLRSLYAPLADGGAVPAPLRATAEAALTVSLHDALRHGAYDEARTLLADLGERVEGGETRQALALAAALLDEQAGDYEGALGRVYALLAGLDPEAQLARDLEATAALLEGRLGAQGRVAPARLASEAGKDVAAIPVDASEAVLLPTYPNPVTGQALVPVVLEEVAEARVAVYDVLGREVSVLHEGTLDAGTHRLRFDGTRLPAGVYLVRAAVTTGGAARTFTERLTLVR